MNKPFVLGVDCDGVIADYFDGFRNFCAHKFRTPARQLPIPHSYDFSSDPLWAELIPDRKKFLDLHNEAVAEGMFAKLRMMEGASIALWELSNMGVYVRIITHRFHKHGDYARVVKDTVEWFDTNSIPYRGLAIERWKSDVGCDLYIDDSPGNVEELRAAGNDCIVFDAPYNKDVPGLRAYSWMGALKIVKRRLEDRGI